MGASVASSPELHLSIQYATASAMPARAALRRLVQAALRAARASGIAAAHRAVLTLRFVDVPEGRELNRSFRGKDYATNVLTFALDDADADAVEADIVVCAPVVAKEARDQHKDVAQHCAHLVVHGTLHACGYDHESPHDACAMEAIERRVLRRFRIPDPYAVVD